MAEKRYDFSQVSILLVDDSRYYRQIVAQLCRNFGFRSVYEAANGKAALDMLAQVPIDIVLCDWIMRPMNGLELTRQIRGFKDAAAAMVPILVLTGSTEQANVLAARDTGATEFLVKPISSATLLTRLIHIVEEPRSFIRKDGFFGPDRRRHAETEPPAEGERRGVDDTSTKTETGEKP